MKAMIIRGDFTEAEFSRVVAVIRDIDAARPSGHFELIALDPEASLAQAEQTLHRIMPTRTGRATSWGVIKRSSP